VIIKRTKEQMKELEKNEIKCIIKWGD